MTPPARPAPRQGPGGQGPAGQGRGVGMGLGAYALWGVFPLYFVLLAPAGPLEILVHRVVWTLLVCVLLLTVMRAWSGIRQVLRAPRTLVLLAAAAVLIATNWLVYTYGVLSEQVVQTALGYYINPLFTVLLGVLVLRERLRPLQWAAVGTGLVAVLVLTAAFGRVPWIALTLAVSFGMYGLLKNRVGRSVDAVHSLSVETAVLAPVALGLITWMQVTGTATFGTGVAHTWLLVSTGAVTAVPLLLFAASARRIPLSTVGLLQYLTPTLQLLIGVFVFDEQMSPSRWAGFALVWIALTALTVDMFRHSQRPDVPSSHPQFTRCSSGARPLGRRCA